MWDFSLNLKLNATNEQQDNGIGNLIDQVYWNAPSPPMQDLEQHGNGCRAGKPVWKPPPPPKTPTRCSRRQLRWVSSKNFTSMSQALSWDRPRLQVKTMIFTTPLHPQWGLCLWNVKTSKNHHYRGFSVYTFGLRGFRFTHLGKIKKNKNTVQFTTRSRMYAVFGHAKAWIVRLMTHNSVTHDFLARSSEALFLRDSLFTQHFQERNPAYNWEPPLYLTKQQTF